MWNKYRKLRLRDVERMSNEEFYSTVERYKLILPITKPRREANKILFKYLYWGY